MSSEPSYRTDRSISSSGSQRSKGTEGGPAQQYALDDLNRLAALLDNVKDLVLEIDGRGVITYVNPRSREFVGLDRQDIIGLPFDTFLHADDAEMVRQRFARRMKGHDVIDCYEARVCGVDGSVCWCELSASPIREGEAIVGTQVIVRDITQRKAAEHKRCESEAVLRSIMMSSTDHILLVDFEGRIQFINRTVKELTVEEVIGMPIFEFVDPEFHPRIRECLETVRETQQPGRYEVDYFSTDDELVHAFEARVGPVIEDGEVVALTITASDITDRKRVENELHEQQSKLAHFGRLSTTGEMVVGIAHEVGQPLGAIANLAAACVRTLDAEEIDRESLKQWLEKIGEAANMTGHIIRRLRTFVNNSEVERCPCDLKRIVGDALTFMAGELRHSRVKTNVKYDESEYIVECDDVQIQQVIVNLLKNACDELTHRSPDNRVIQISTRSAVDEIEVIVDDSGGGLLGKDLEQLFDRFYTSKSDGMGMGLAISRSIVDAHGGRLWAQSSDIGGASFRFTLPKADKTAHPKV